MTPQDLAAEQGVLGGMLQTKDAIADVIDAIRGRDFYQPAHELIFDAILDLYGRGEPVDVVTVADQLNQRGEMARIGGAEYLRTLMSSAPTAANASYYAIIVRDRAILRRLIEAGTRISQMGYDSDGADLDEIVNRAQQEIHGVTGQRAGEGEVLSEIMESTLDEIEAISNRSEMSGVPTGFADLDSLTQGLHRRQMTVIGSRSAVGKSTLALDLLRSAALRNGLPSALFTTESTANEMNMRLLSAECRIALHRMRAGTMSDDDWAKMARRMGEVSAAPLFIHDKDHMTLAYVEQKCRTLVSRYGLRLAVIDSIHGLMYGTRPFENRYLEVAEISRRLKQLAKELDIAVVAVATLNRNWQAQRQDWQWNRPPILSDLRDSGTLEDDADVVILVHRDDHLERESPRAGEADLIVAKHRHGPTATITVAFQGHFSRFVDMAAGSWATPASLIDAAMKSPDEVNTPVANTTDPPDGAAQGA
jgi:replicative DNA helicase